MSMILMLTSSSLKLMETSTLDPLLKKFLLHLDAFLLDERYN